MCGFAGFYNYKVEEKVAKNLLVKMGERIKHRGPDDSGVWYDYHNGIGLSHRRLAIIDLTKSGHQPMFSSNGRFTIAFNGEIYNHDALRQELCLEHDIVWVGTSDTETLLECFSRWGVEKTVLKATGMFSIALWDAEEKSITLIRDRIGEKPLYYGWQNGSLLFGSELSSLEEHPFFNAVIDKAALTHFIKRGFVRAPLSIYKGIKKLQPGYIVTFTEGSVEPKKTCYWSLDKVIHNRLHNEPKPENSVAELERVLKSAIEKQLMADVPLGAFLSGGVDSSLIVALMQQLSSSPVKTFSIGFHEAGYDEAIYAKEVASHLGTEHTELYVTEKDALDVIPTLADIYSEPFADSSQIPTYLVAKMARESVTVTLSGDGGDELFAGYSRYVATFRAWKKLKLIPFPVRKFISNFIRAIPVKVWNYLFFNKLNLGDKFHKGAYAITSQTFEAFYDNFLMSHYHAPEEIVEEGLQEDNDHLSAKPEGLDDYEQMTYADLKRYLPDDILCKVDRASMASSLETRVPLLDHNVVEASAAMPMGIKRKHGIAKWPLRKILYKYVPKEMIERPKKGFGVPLEKWLKGGLKTWAEGLLNEDKIKEQGLLNPKLVKKLWSEHQSGERNWSYVLWNILMFQLWLSNKSKKS